MSGYRAFAYLILAGELLQQHSGHCYRLGGCQLAVLHPRKLVIYSITSLSSGQGVAAVQLNKISEQVLERSAANMVSGSFGGSTGVAAVVSIAASLACQNITRQEERYLSRETVAGAVHICIQSMDGQLSFYEKERLAFSRFLPQFLLPGPLCYCQALDSLITCSSAFEVECYKYQTLAAAQAAAEKTTGDLS